MYLGLIFQTSRVKRFLMQDLAGPPLNLTLHGVNYLSNDPLVLKTFLTVFYVVKSESSGTKRDNNGG